MDEKEGPYKVVSKLVSSRDPLKYSIVKKHKNDVFLQEVVPDAGEGSTARHICNLLNKNWRENRDTEADGTGTTDVGGVADPDQ